MNTTSSPTNCSASNATGTVYSVGQSPYITEPGWVETFRLTVQVLLAFTGFVGNVLVVLVITVQPKMKTVMNCLIRNLAIADICILIFTFPSGIVKEQAMYHWPLGEFACRAVFPFLDSFYGVSIWSITAIAIDRYKAIVSCVQRPNKERALKRTRYTMVLIWLVSVAVISLPLYVVTKLRDNRPAFVVCSATWPNEVTSKVYLLGVFLFWYVIPLTVVIWTFLMISKKLHSSTKFNKRISRDLCSDPDAESPKIRIRERQNSKAKRILVPVVVVFALTMLPMNAFRLAVVFKPSIIYDRFFWVYYHISLTFIVANSAANCFIYSIVSKEFRQGFRRLFHGTGQRLSHLVASPLLSYRRRKPSQKTKSSIV